jgi:hypothetical protein
VQLCIRRTRAKAVKRLLRIDGSSSATTSRCSSRGGGGGSGGSSGGAGGSGSSGGGGDSGSSSGGGCSGSSSSSSRPNTGIRLSAAVHLAPPALRELRRFYSGIGPFTEEWMDEHVGEEDRRYFDEVDFTGMDEPDKQPRLFVPNLDRRDWLPTAPVVSKMRRAAAGQQMLRARKRVIAEVEQDLDRQSPEAVASIASGDTPPVKVPFFDVEARAAAFEHHQAAIAELKLQAGMLQQQLRAAEEQERAAQASLKRLRKKLAERKRHWFMESNLHPTPTVSKKYSVQAYFFGIGGTYAGMVALLRLLFNIKEEHSDDARGKPLTAFEECLIAKAYLHRRTPQHVLSCQVRFTCSFHMLVCFCTCVPHIVRFVVHCATAMRSNTCFKTSALPPRRGCVQANCSVKRVKAALKKWIPRWGEAAGAGGSATATAPAAGGVAAAVASSTPAAPAADARCDDAASAGDCPFEDATVTRENDAEDAVFASALTND